MYENEITTKAWAVSEEVFVRKINQTSVAAEEQECHFNVEKIDGTGKESVRVCCSHQGMITKLSKSEFFTLTEVLVSDNPQNKGYVLEIVGELDPKGLTIRAKKPSLNAEQVRKLRQRAKDNLHKP